MLNEIKEQPQVLKELIEKFVKTDFIDLKFPELDKKIASLRNIYIVASGSSRNVGIIAAYAFEKYSRIPAKVEFASEFAHRELNLTESDLVLAISQSGETADTLAALKKAKENGAITFALTNNPNSKIHKLADCAMIVGAGEEKSIAATKSLTAQLINIYFLSLYFGLTKKAIDIDLWKSLTSELKKLPVNLQKIIENIDEIEQVTEKIKNSKNLVILGRGINYGSACEAALKIKETCYIDANGFPTGEFLHGYVAVVDEAIPVISIIHKGKRSVSKFKLAVGNTESIKIKRNPPMIIFTNVSKSEFEKNETLKDSLIICIPDCHEEFSAFYYIVLFQLIAYKTALLLGREIEKPRGLTKAVTVE
ncbi:MAG: SIS domain-containing protein [bacterium]